MTNHSGKTYVELSSVTPYLRSYQSTEHPQQWAINASKELNVGSVLFFLEQTIESPTNAVLHLSGASIVVGHTSQRPIIIYFTEEYYRTLLLEEILTVKAEQAKQFVFSYALVEPAEPLSEATIDLIQQAGRTNINGGTRLDPNSSSTTDPAVALLDALGVAIDPFMSGMILDFGQLLNALLDTNDTNLNKVFRLVSDSNIVLPAQITTPTQIDNNSIEQPSIEPHVFDLFNQLGETLTTVGPVKAEKDISLPTTIETNSPQVDPKQSQKLSRFKNTTVPQQSSVKIPRAPSKVNAPTPPSTSIKSRTKLNRPIIENTSYDTESLDEVFLDLANIFDFDVDNEKSQSSDIALLETITNDFTEIKEIKKDEPLVDSSINSSINQDQLIKTAPLIPSANQMPSSVELILSTKVDLQSTVVANSVMSPLIDRLEQQVSRAAQKLATQAEGILESIKEEVTRLVEVAAEEERQNEESYLKIASNVSQHLDTIAKQAHATILDSSTSGQNSIRYLLESSKSTVDRQSQDLISTLTKDSKLLKVEFSQLSKIAHKKFNSLVRKNNGEINSLIAEIIDELNIITAFYLDNITAKFNKTSQRISLEIGLISQYIEQYSQSLENDLDQVWEQTTTQVGLRKAELRVQIDDVMREWQQRSVALLNSIVNLEVFPKLKEFRDQIDSKSEELKHKFIAQSEANNFRRSKELGTTVDNLKNSLKQLSSGSLASISESVSQQKSKLIKLFSGTQDHIFQLIEAAEKNFESIETQIKSSDTISRQLLISSGSTLDLSLISSRDQLVMQLQGLQSSSIANLNDLAQQRAEQLDEVSKQGQNKLGLLRQEYKHTIKEECHLALAQVQNEVKKSFDLIQKTREKHLE